MTEYTKLEEIRLEKIETLRAEGIEVYPTRAKRTHTSAEAIAAFEKTEENEESGSEGSEEEVVAILTGRLRSARNLGKISFAHIEDGAGRIQLFFRINDIGKEKLDFFAKMFDLG
ncbi:MAG: lysine--tRNA ligase, partial [Anaerolineae bacterium]|nr:lysine--tRNA ligase [Anaerolineae bacterium]